ncbi:hypothetical protein JCM17380_16580 [Desulfosporosinus burensis]
MQKLAFCGNDCVVCPRYTATQSSDVLKLNAVAKLWNQLGLREAIESPEKIMCYGCSSSSFCRYGIQQCATENAVDNCGKCQGYPCNLTFKSFEQTEIYAESIKRKCSDEEYQRLKKAFFYKKENLDKAQSQSQNIARLGEDE